MRLFVCLLIFLPLAVTVNAQYSMPDAPEEPVPTSAAVHTEVAPVLDGLVIGDPAYAQTIPISQFWQTTPQEGQPASERTEVYLVYTDRALYVGVICYDREPEAIIVSDTRRDAPLDETDSFQMILDTFLDGQNGFVFGTNPAGIEYDAQVTKEGQGGFGARQQAGSGGGFNINWDGSWDVQTSITDEGWSAEFEIPFRTIRFPAARQQTWGINFQRNIRRRNERAFWTRMPRQHQLSRVSQAGRVSGLIVPQPRNLQVVPYTLGQVTRTFEPGDRQVETSSDLGLDLKYSVTPSLTLDASYNTDFAQVEVDEQQVNLDRFNLFFPEKRPFFLENAGLFSIGVSEFSGQEVELFFSRRIGIGPSGEVIPILGGTRLSGQMAGVNVGLLTMQTREVQGAAAGTNFSVARIRKDLANRSAIGFMATSRLHMDAEDATPVEEDNQALAVDGRWGIGEFATISGFVARTFSPQLEGAEHAYNINADYVSNVWRINGTFTEVAENFNPGIGFLRRSNEYRKITGLVLYAWRPENSLGLLELRPHVSYQGYWDFAGFQEGGRWHIDNHWEWKSGFEVHTGINLTREGVQEDFEISGKVRIPAGTYDHREAQLVLITNQGRKVSISSRAVLGGFFGGTRRNVSTTLRIRANEALTTELDWSHNDVRLPGGDFVINLVQTRISYSFTPRLYVQGLFQYSNSIGDVWSANLRLGWLQTANTGLFVVLNDVSESSQPFHNSLGRTITVKYSRLLNVLR